MGNLLCTDQMCKVLCIHLLCFTVGNQCVYSNYLLSITGGLGPCVKQCFNDNSDLSETC